MDNIVAPEIEPAEKFKILCGLGRLRHHQQFMVLTDRNNFIVIRNNDIITSIVFPKNLIFRGKRIYYSGS